MSRGGEAEIFLLVTGASGAGKTTVRELIADELAPDTEIAAGEVIAAPSAGRLDAIAICLLDVSLEVQAARLAHRGDDPRSLRDHQAFADWMRAHAQDPNHMPHVLSAGGWEAMRWERLGLLHPRSGARNMYVLDTSAQSPGEVAEQVLNWSRRALLGHAPRIKAQEGRK